jgi:glucose-6-phosphate isomerase
VLVGPDAPELVDRPPDAQLVRLRSVGVAAGGPADVTVTASLGAQLVLWEHATAVAGRLLGINPFDQPDVESAKAAARGLLERPGSRDQPAAVSEGPLEVRATGGWLPDVDTLAGALDALCEQLTIRPGGYLAVMAYLDRGAHPALSGARDALARRTGRPVTFGWGPRFLHSTGQYHKGGPPTGVFLQITADPPEDLEVPGRGFTFGQLIAAQAAGDADVLAARGCPVLRVHLTDRRAGVPAIVRAVTG